MLDGGHNDLHHITCEFFQTPESDQNLEKYLLNPHRIEKICWTSMLELPHPHHRPAVANTCDQIAAGFDQSLAEAKNIVEACAKFCPEASSISFWKSDIDPFDPREMEMDLRPWSGWLWTLSIQWCLLCAKCGRRRVRKLKVRPDFMFELEMWCDDMWCGGRTHFYCSICQTSRLESCKDCRSWKLTWYKSQLDSFQSKGWSQLQSCFQSLGLWYPAKSADLLRSPPLMSFELISLSTKWPVLLWAMLVSQWSAPWPNLACRWPSTDFTTVSFVVKLSFLSDFC